jgi:DNA-binding response OmpR family regulator
VAENAVRSALVAEDNDAVRAAILAVVSQLGFEARAVTDGAIAHGLLLTEPPDLLVVDIGLPYVGGVALIRSLKALKPSSRVIAISGMGDHARRSALAAGADAFLAKPFAGAELEQTVAGLGL